MFVSLPNSYVKTLDPKVMVFGHGVLGGDWIISAEASCTRLVPL